MIRYTKLFAGNGLSPFLYCDEEADFVLRDEDRDRASALATENRAEETEALEAFYADLEQRLPRCPCGGTFRLSATPRCPSCRAEVSSGGADRRLMRYYDSEILWIEGATAFGGRSRPAARLVEVIVERQGRRT